MGKPKVGLNEQRCRRLVDSAIEKFSLDLSGLVVLTEAASGNFSLTPLIAAVAGAERVVAIGRDSRYGRMPEIRAALHSISRNWGVDGRIAVIESRADPLVQEADTVTNLGFVRPFDAEFLARLKSTAAVSLMWETWEFRAEEFDLQACRKLGLAVLGTNEDHVELQTYAYLGHVAIKLLFELDVEVFRSKLVIVGSGKFATSICKILKNSGADSVDIVTPAKDMKTHPGWYSADGVVIAEHRMHELLFGATGLIDPEWLAKANPGVGVVHICGNVDEASLTRSGLRYVPTPIARRGYMSVTTDYIGPRPLIDLHAAGLKVGEMLARRRLDGFSAIDAERLVLSESTIAQGFEGAHQTVSTRGVSE